MALAVLIVGLYMNILNRAGASVSDVSEAYLSTTTPYAGQINGVGGVVLLKGNTTGNANGVLGSVVVTGGPKGGTIALYDATTSDVTKRLGNLSTSSITLVEIPAGTASTTYVLDSNFNTGLLLVTTGSVATTTITWK